MCPQTKSDADRDVVLPHSCCECLQTAVQTRGETPVTRLRRRLHLRIDEEQLGTVAADFTCALQKTHFFERIIEVC